MTAPLVTKCKKVFQVCSLNKWRSMRMEPPRACVIMQDRSIFKRTRCWQTAASTLLKNYSLAQSSWWVCAAATTHSMYFSHWRTFARFICSPCSAVLALVICIVCLTFSSLSIYVICSSNSSKAYLEKVKSQSIIMIQLMNKWMMLLCIGNSSASFHILEEQLWCLETTSIII